MTISSSLYGAAAASLFLVVPAMGVGNCGCSSSCTSSVLDKDADGHKVRDRIDWVIANMGQSEQDACSTVCGDEFQDVCGAQCDPGQCGGGGGGGGGSRCGCSSCTDSVLGRDANGFPVGNRIDWVMANLGRSEEDACDLVCGVEYSDVCGECDCDGGGGGGGGGGGPKCDGCSWDDGSTCPDWWCNESQSNCNVCTGTWFGGDGGGGGGGGGGGFACGANQFTFHNKANKPVFIYNFPYQSQPPTFPLTGSSIGADQKLCIDFVSEPIMRIYVADKRLSESIEKGRGPDGGNPDVDGDVMWSFVEYFWEPGASRYTFDLSYIDEFSYPVTAKFSNVGSYGGAIEGHEYGPKKMSSIRSALEQQTDFTWKGLIWPINGSTSQWHQWPGLYRVVGPNKVWQFSTNGGSSISPFAPTNFWDFLGSVPKNGRQLFGSSGTNWDIWQFNGGNQQPSNTGYTKALHAVSQPDSRGKYGFFCYPEDNKDGEFTWMPTSVQTTVTIYPFNT